jgi:hypothetical protein
LYMHVAGTCCWYRGAWPDTRWGDMLLVHASTEPQALGPPGLRVRPRPAVQALLALLHLRGWHPARLLTTWGAEPSSTGRRTGGSAALPEPAYLQRCNVHARARRHVQQQRQQLRITGALCQRQPAPACATAAGKAGFGSMASFRLRMRCGFQPRSSNYKPRGCTLRCQGAAARRSELPRFRPCWP